MSFWLPSWEEGKTCTSMSPLDFSGHQLGEIVRSLGIGMGRLGDVAELEHGFGERGNAEANGQQNDCAHEERFMTPPENDVGGADAAKTDL